MISNISSTPGRIGLSSVFWSGCRICFYGHRAGSWYDLLTKPAFNNPRTGSSVRSGRRCTSLWAYHSTLSSWNGKKESYPLWRGFICSPALFEFHMELRILRMQSPSSAFIVIVCSGWRFSQQSLHFSVSTVLLDICLYRTFSG